MHLRQIEGRLSFEIAKRRRRTHAELRHQRAAHLHGPRIRRAMEERGIVAGGAGHAARAGQHAIVEGQLAQLCRFAQRLRGSDGHRCSRLPAVAAATRQREAKAGCNSDK